MVTQRARMAVVHVARGIGRGGKRGEEVTCFTDRLLTADSARPAMAGRMVTRYPAPPNRRMGPVDSGACPTSPMVPTQPGRASRVCDAPRRGFHPAASMAQTKRPYRREPVGPMEAARVPPRRCAPRRCLVRRQVGIARASSVLGPNLAPGLLADARIPAGSPTPAQPRLQSQRKQA